MQSVKNFNYTVIIKCTYIHNCIKLKNIVPLHWEPDYTFNIAVCVCVCVCVYITYNDLNKGGRHKVHLKDPNWGHGQCSVCQFHALRTFIEYKKQVLGATERAPNRTAETSSEHRSVIQEGHWRRHKGFYRPAIHLLELLSTSDSLN